MDILKPIYFILGFADYARDRADELREEFIRRGREKSDDVREFFDDVLENMPMMTRRDKETDEEEVDAGETEDEKAAARGFLKYYKLDDAKESARDVLENLGLATAADLEDLHEKLDRMQETVKNLLKKK